MIGYIFTLGRNANGQYTYGKITGEDGEEYFFHKSYLINCNIRSLEEGDAVDFEPGLDAGRRQAYNVRKKYQSNDQSRIPEPGIHPSIDLSIFNDDEQKIIQFLKSIFYVSNGGNEFTIRQSTYRYCLVKPTDYFYRTFSLTREIVVIFCDYVTFEPRSLDAAGRVYERIGSKLRLDKACHIFISHSSKIEEELESVLKDGNLNQIVIPFSYQELLSDKANDSIVHDRFRKYLFDTDLFAVSSPITNDSFFFGRRDYVHDIVAKCKNCTPSGVFGLRRSGKTSLLYAVQNLLEQQGYPTVYIPCGDLNSKDWKNALCKVIKEIFKRLDLDDSKVTESYYSTDKTREYFEEDLDYCLSRLNVPITLLFDEIEEITFEIAHAEQTDDLWIDGENYCKFWRSIKAYYLKHPHWLSILVAGTNPMINEEPFVKNYYNKENPMYHFFSESNQGAYLQAFTDEDTRNMVNTLGGYMGISFDDRTVGQLTNDCGGHPYLTRLLCSHINRYVKSKGYQHPIRISKAIYDKALPDFEKSNEATNFFEMILNILISRYPLEFETLKVLALEGDHTISQVKDQKALQHLIGYGLVDSNNNNYAIKYNTIFRFLKGEYKFERKGLSLDEQKQEIWLRVDHAEIQLRKIVRINLKNFLGTEKAKQCVIDAMQNYSAISEKTVRRAEALDYNKLFDPSVNSMYFPLLKNLIVDNYSFFTNVFEKDTFESVKEHLEAINSGRKCADHGYTDESENWSWTQFEAFRESMSWLERIISDYE